MMPLEMWWQIKKRLCNICVNWAQNLSVFPKYVIIMFLQSNVNEKWYPLAQVGEIIALSLVGEHASVTLWLNGTSGDLGMHS